ncbi:hypothetical protein SAMN02745163_03831 [Clostridium cavendishii DSM 21758]|uniref:Uncharacterized protein n=1 Tax=Clostridium cavendishii DSM 21758 TaxID=1121302 RepID=A0A1M6SK97_9CLOT|nr:hypothetical protein [Clostridium cavendishii]SHK45019.1 hypothetical protein SAMN02745163_03831 [Clostridium cavendishii DSM 21758]
MKNKYILIVSVIVVIIGILLLKNLYINNKNISIANDTKASKENVSEIDMKKFDLSKKGCYWEEYAASASHKDPIKFKKFDGIYDLDTIKLKKGDWANLCFNSDISGGSFNIVVVDPKANVIKTIKPNSEGKTTIQANEDGEYKVKMLGDKASGKAFGYWES